MAKSSKILIVDDEPFNVDLLEQQLEDLGYETITAFNGQEALDQVAAEAPDLILLDVMMPIMDGFATCRKLKENAETQLIPIVIMTALDAFEDRIKGIEAGADDFLTKPVDERELLARIHTTLKLKHTVEDKINEVGQVRDHFAKFVPEVVKQRVEANPEAPDLAKSDQDTSVIFLDISGYTRLSEELPPGELNSLVERYFSAFLDRIHEIGGEICETSGDGLMIIFQDRDPWKHAVMAVDTAVALFAIPRALNEESGEYPLELHMGINSGIASVGSTRYEGQTVTRWVFTADGLVPNLAARLASLAEPGQILVGPETAKRLADRYPLQKLGRQRLKNITEPIEVHCIQVSVASS